MDHVCPGGISKADYFLLVVMVSDITSERCRCHARHMSRSVADLPTAEKSTPSIAILWHVSNCERRLISMVAECVCLSIVAVVSPNERVKTILVITSLHASDVRILVERHEYYQ